MSLDEKVAQMVMPATRGIFISEDSEEFQRLTRLVKERRVGGLIFFQGNVLETSYLITLISHF
jgi:hypothetical protein